MAKSLDSQRTYALVGTGGSGKTSLAEMLMFQSGVINRLGKTEEGTTALDYEPEEVKRRGSIQPGFATMDWDKNRHFLMDIPGDNNFVGDINHLLFGVDGAIFVIDAVDGVRPLTKRLWNFVQTAELPSIVFINKMDRDRADFDGAFNGLSTTLSIRPVLLQMPIGQAEDFKGFIDVLNNKAHFFNKDGKVEEGDVPEDMAEEVSSLRETTIENIAESNDDLMEHYLETGELSQQQITTGLRDGVLSRELIPVMIGSALENKGGVELLNSVQDLLPSPLQHPAWIDAEGNERASSPDEPLAVLTFKTLSDPFAGQLSMMRVLSGSFNGDAALKNINQNETERIGSPLFMNGKESAPARGDIGPGSIIAVPKLKATNTGDTLADPKAPFQVAMPDLPPNLISYALAPKEKGDEDKVYAAVQRLLNEDITLNLSRDAESSDIILAGMGQVHIETSVERAMRRFKCDIILKTPKIPYRESIKGKAQVQGRHKKQSGGRGQFGDCWIEIEGMPQGFGYEFVNAIVGGVIPRQYIPAVNKGIQEAAQRGCLAGYPLVDFKVKLYDGSYHAVDSSEMAFKIAGSLALRGAMDQVTPTLLEPIVLMTVHTPDEFMGDVIGDLSSRRGKVLGSDSIAGLTEIKAHVPMGEVLRYAPDLRSITGGQGVFTMEFDHYEEAPPPVIDKVVAEKKAS